MWSLHSWRCNRHHWPLFIFMALIFKCTSLHLYHVCMFVTNHYQVQIGLHLALNQSSFFHWCNVVHSTPRLSSLRSPLFSFLASPVKIKIPHLFKLRRRDIFSFVKQDKVTFVFKNKCEKAVGKGRFSGLILYSSLPLCNKQWSTVCYLPACFMQSQGITRGWMLSPWRRKQSLEN